MFITGSKKFHQLLMTRTPGLCDAKSPLAGLGAKARDPLNAMCSTLFQRSRDGYDTEFELGAR